MLRTLHRRALSAAALTLMAGCAHNRLTHTWQDPRFATPRFSSALVIAAVPDQFAGRIYEDAFVKFATAAGIAATPGYSMLSEDGPATRDQLRVATAKIGAQAVIISSIVKRDVDMRNGIVYAQGTGFYDYYVGVWQVNTLPTGNTTVSVTVQTNVYDVATEGLVWSGTTESSPNTRLSDESPDLAKLLVTDMVNRQILAAATTEPAARATH
jgi:hypothetical protein